MGIRQEGKGIMPTLELPLDGDLSVDPKVDAEEAKKLQARRMAAAEQMKTEGRATIGEMAPQTTRQELNEQDGQRREDPGTLRLPSLE